MTYYKIMWMPEPESIIWHWKTGTPAKESHMVVEEMAKYIDLLQWRIDYARQYQNWLADLGSEIYDLKSSLNSSIIDSIGKFNGVSKVIKIFYWFDVDREKDEGFVWRKCPLTGESLFDLGEDFPNNNRLISERKFLVFPKNL